MQWLKQQEGDIALHWIERTDLPMLVTLVSGEILDANQAFLRVMGYTESELLGKLQPDGTRKGGLTWMQLSANDSDLQADLIAATQLEEGTITEYWVGKHYLPKAMPPQPVVIHVQRFPLSGPMKCALVSAHFSPHLAQQTVIATIQRMEDRLIHEMTQKADAILGVQDTLPEQLVLTLVRVFAKYPKTSLFLVVTFGLLVLGDKLLLAIQGAMSLFSPSGPST